MAGKPVAIIMGSQSDWATMKHAAETLEALGIGFEPLIVSAHRTPDRLFRFEHLRRVVSGRNDLSAFAPTQPRRSERILGEECFWSGPSGAQGIDFTSGGLHACITSDALALRTIEGDRAIASYVATGIDRGRQPASALMPPAAAFDWRSTSYRAGFKRA